MRPGRILGIVGESGSGKSLTARAIMRMLPDMATITDGTLSFRGQDLSRLPESRMREIRGREIAIVFHDPQSALNPVKTVGWQIEEALRAGAKAHVDPKGFSADKPGTPYLAPQVLTGVNHQMSVMREESFGPVVGIMKVKDEAEAIHLMNDSPYGLTASVWTTDVEAAARIGGKIETGTVYMNRCDYLDPALVWTGVKDTGRGAALSRIGYEVLTRPKSFHLRIAI